MGRLSRIFRSLGWYVGSLMGDNHYRRYVAHRRRAHPGQPVVSEAQYWRMRHRQADSNPSARCC